MTTAKLAEVLDPLRATQARLEETQALLREALRERDEANARANDWKRQHSEQYLQTVELRQQLADAKAESLAIRRRAVSELQREFLERTPKGAQWCYLTPDRILVVLGTPDEDDEGHNCDAMGCGQEHVVERIRLPRVVREPIADTGDYETNCSLCGMPTDEPHEPEHCCKNIEASCEELFEVLSEMVGGGERAGHENALRNLQMWLNDWIRKCKDEGCSGTVLHALDVVAGSMLKALEVSCPPK